jgi:hypothetical protein
MKPTRVYNLSRDEQDIRDFLYNPTSSILPNPDSLSSKLDISKQKMYYSKLIVLLKL